MILYRINVSQDSSQSKIINHLPSFIKAYTLFSQQYDEIPTPLLSILYKMVNIFIQKYNQFALYTRTPGIYAIQSLIKTIFIKGEGYLHSFLNHFCKYTYIHLKNLLVFKFIIY